MSVLDDATMDVILDGWLGTTRGSSAPDSYSVEIWDDDPRNDDAAQLDYPEYEPVEWDSDDWDDADGGEKETTGYVEFAEPSAEATNAGTHWALRDVATDDLAFCAPLERPVDVTGAGDPIQIRLKITFPSPD